MDAPRFDESFVVYKQEVELTDECPVCKGPKNKVYKTCSYSCSGHLHRRVDWDSIDLAALFEKGLTQMAIAEMLGVSDAAVFKRARKLGLKKSGLRKKESNLYLPH
jgi:hypothetical protein